jgi:hypothetical protein
VKRLRACGIDGALERANARGERARKIAAAGLARSGSSDIQRLRPFGWAYRGRVVLQGIACAMLRCLDGGRIGIDGSRGNRA